MWVVGRIPKFAENVPFLQEIRPTDIEDRSIQKDSMSEGPATSDELMEYMVGEWEELDARKLLLRKQVGKARWRFIE